MFTDLERRQHDSDSPSRGSGEVDGRFIIGVGERIPAGRQPPSLARSGLGRGYVNLEKPPGELAMECPRLGAEVYNFSHHD